MAEFLYIHIPFCIRKCIYCDFLSVPYDAAVAHAYTDALCRELHMRRGQAGFLKAVYIGGGTPTLLDESCFRKIFSCLRDNFMLPASAEITVEANPKTIDTAKIRCLFELGVNRMSVGIQSFDDRELKTLGRAHNSGDAANAIALMQKAGLKNLSLDLMYGIPGQTPESWERTLALASGFSPSHISAYELTPEADTPLTRFLSTGELVMSDEDLVIHMYHQAIDYLSRKGFEHYEISNFSLPGCRCIHNLNYWDRGEYIGAGAGSHSFTGGTRARNTKDISRYIRQITDAVPPVEASYGVTPEEETREFIFLGLRKREGISLTATKAIGPEILVQCSELIEEGFLDTVNGHIRLTRKGLAIANTVIVSIFEKLGL